MTPPIKGDQKPDLLKDSVVWQLRHTRSVLSCPTNIFQTRCRIPLSRAERWPKYGTVHKTYYQFVLLISKVLIHPFEFLIWDRKRTAGSNQDLLPVRFVETNVDMHCFQGGKIITLVFIKLKTIIYIHCNVQKWYKSSNDSKARNWPIRSVISFKDHKSLTITKKPLSFLVVMKESENYSFLVPDCSSSSKIQ